jgi:serine O-acetyltransferase
MNEDIKADLFRHEALTGTKGFLKGLMVPGFRYMYVIRKLSGAKKGSIKWIFFTLLKRRYQFKYGFQIEPSTQIGRGFYIGHFGTIVINPKSKIGINCNIAPGVTIGQTNRGRLRGVPTIGDRVWIGANAVIVGGITIGSNVLIAPNAYVNTDVPSNSLVMGNPAKIIPKENPCDNYVVFILEESL